MEIERRQYPRYPTLQPIEVYDLHSDRYLGRLVDLSVRGFMVLCETVIDADSIWALRLVLPDASEWAELQLGADCLWYRAGEDGRNGWAGFQIIDIADGEADRLHQLLERR
jgi:hypothetical protein